ncbi:hypothetical protein OVA26_16560 [Microbacterium sp. SL62]|uniref:hypothetical protein n=1 Tax=Microbacterium sp. SL62 TaxID=2995139 RepID=UPI00227331EF|nr:hypothetical protein [Microbacterium sp. SL62]MCY1718550.1 hypothetical protein [Microbacterium sp. SL62]
MTAVSDAPPRRLSTLAVLSLVVTATGFLTAIGFVLGAVLAHLALVRLRFDRGAHRRRGRRLAIAALWLSYTALIGAGVALLVVLLVAFAELPAPPRLF